mgnify:CR=1 FL=1
MLDSARLVEARTTKRRRRRDRDRARSTTAPARSPRRGRARRSPGRWPAATPGAFGGKKINSLPVWLAFCAVFLLGLADLRRPLSLRNLDLLALLSFSVSLWYFNHGDVFTSVPLAYPPLVVPARALRLDRRARRGRARGAPVWPVWLLLAARASSSPASAIGLNLERLERDRRRLRRRDRRAADRRSGVMPYGHFPERGRPARRAARPTPTARSATASRPTAAASRRTRSATPTGRSPTRRTCPAYWIVGWSRQVGQAPGRAR